MLQPKRVKYRRPQDGRGNKGNAHRGTQLAFGSFGIKTLEPKWIDSRQIEAARVALNRYMSVNGIFTCYDKPMEVFDYNALKDDPLIEVDTIGLKGSPTNVFKSFTPPQKGAGTMLKGDDTAAQLAGILAKKHLI